MDIDKYSRLLHEEHQARQSYLAHASRNVYGLTLAEESQAYVDFKLAQHRLSVAQGATRNYLTNALPY